MANTLLTPTEIAMEGLILVQSNMVTGRLFDRSYEGEIATGKVGESILVRRRQNGTVNLWSPGTLTVDPIVETSIPITLDNHYDASVEVTSRDRQFKIKQFSEQIMEPQMVALAEQIDTYACSKLKDLPEVWPAAPAALPTTALLLAGIRRKLNELKVPMQGRVQIISPEYEENLLGAVAFNRVNESGSDGALRRAELGDLLGMSFFMDQNVDTATHTTGTMATAACSADHAAGATTIAYDTGDQASGTWTAGDIVTIAGYGNVVVDALATATSNAGTFVIREPLREDVADTTVLTNYDGGGNTYKSHGAAFNSKAFAFVAPALQPHVHAPESASVTDPNTGVSLRVTFDFDRVNKRDVMSVDALIGVKMIDGRLGCQVLQNV